MDVNDLKGLYAECKKRMDAQVEHVRRELSGVRTGRASTALLENVMVEAYGARMPLNQVATLSIPEPSLIVAHCFTASSSISIALSSSRRFLEKSLKTRSMDSHRGPRSGRRRMM